MAELADALDSKSGSFGSAGSTPAPGTTEKNGCFHAPLSIGKAVMTKNKETVQRYMDCFCRSDHDAVLSCLTDDVEWIVPGFFHVTGKAAFDKQIENEAFVGSPTIRVSRLIEENGVVVAEGTVGSEKKAGGYLNAVFCDVFEMQDGKIKRLVSYLMEAPAG